MTFRAFLFRGAVLLLAACALSLTVAHAAPIHSSSAAAVFRASSGPYQRALDDLHAGRYAQAEQGFRDAIKKHDHVFLAYAGLGAAAYAVHDYVTAFHAYQHAAALQPKNPLVEYRTAYCALYSNDYHSAVTYASNYIKLEPKDPSGYRLRFLAYGSLLDRKHQLQDARAEVKFAPRSADAHNDLGIALSNNREYAQAISEFNTAIRLAPSDPDYYQNRGQAEYQDKKLAAALADFERARALTKDPLKRKQLDTVIAYLKKQLHK
jgi:Tfp pilus assembly protein PilF